MNNRPIMFVPSSFTIGDNTSIVLVDCRIIMHEGWNMLHANVYKDHFQGFTEIEGYDIYTEDHPVVFVDKIEAYIKQEESLL